MLNYFITATMWVNLCYLFIRWHLTPNPRKRWLRELGAPPVWRGLILPMIRENHWHNKVRGYKPWTSFMDIRAFVALCHECFGDTLSVCRSLILHEFFTNTLVPGHVPGEYFLLVASGGLKEGGWEPWVKLPLPWFRATGVFELVSLPANLSGWEDEDKCEGEFRLALIPKKEYRTYSFYDPYIQENPGWGEGVVDGYQAGAAY